MLRLDSTTRKLELLLDGPVSTNQLSFLASWSDATSSSYSGGSTPGITNNTTAVTLTSSPSPSTIRDIDYVSVRNSDTSPATVTVQYNDNSTTYVIIKVSMGVGDQLVYTHAHGWYLVDSSGSTKTGVTGPMGPAGNQGPIGPSGITVILDGQDGEDGSIGPQGIPGAPGQNGQQGQKGDIGFPGMDGQDGEDGFMGPPGVAGPPGQAGQQGQKGDTGIPGLDGLDGDDGIMGPPGVSGQNGQTGPQGVPGVPIFLTSSDGSTDDPADASIPVAPSSKDSISVWGDINVNSIGSRVKGNFSDATLGNRTMVQTNVVNGNSTVGVLPNGTAVMSELSLETDPAVTNGQFASFKIDGAADARIQSGIRGSGSYLPLTFYTGGSERLHINAGGKIGMGATPNSSWGSTMTALEFPRTFAFWGSNQAMQFSTNLYNDGTGVKYATNGPGGRLMVNYSLGSVYMQTFSSGTAGSSVTTAGSFLLDNGGNAVMTTANGAIGYATGSAGTVTQNTDKSTAVTLNKPNGVITMNSAALAAGASVTFTLNNSVINGTDLIYVNSVDGTNYRVETFIVSGGGQAGIRVTNISAGSLSDALVLNFYVKRGASA